MSRSLKLTRPCSMRLILERDARMAYPARSGAMPAASRKRRSCAPSIMRRTVAPARGPPKQRRRRTQVLHSGATALNLLGPAPRRDTMTGTMTSFLDLTSEYGAHNYHPLPIVAAEAEGAWVTDVDGRRYLDMLAAYSALNFGHRHPRLIAAARRQLEHLTLVSRAFDHDQFGPFCAELAELAGMDVVLPMNTGAEAVETAIKVARKWGYTVKGVPADQAVIIVFSGNFHGRTTTIISFSTDEDSRADFGPYTPGFRIVPYGDLDALTAAVGELGERVVAVLVEPIQGEARSEEHTSELQSL